MRIRSRHTRSMLFCSSLLLAPPLVAEVDVLTNPDSGLTSWQLVQGALSVQFIQLHPDYVQAFYAARGLPDDLVLEMRAQCIFGTILRNLSGAELDYRVKEWRYLPGGGESLPVPSKSDWVERWQDLGVAFQWSLLPDQQRLAPGDWNQGFTTLPEQTTERFALQLVWREQGKEMQASIEEMFCANVQ